MSTEDETGHSKGTQMHCGSGGYWSSRRSQPVDPNMRVSDAERDRVAEALSEHYSAGRLDANELKERLDKAIGAKTRGDLSGLMTDLPHTYPTTPEPHRERRRVAVWVAVAIVICATAFPWQATHLFWVPRIPWLVLGIVALVFFSRRRRRHPTHVHETF
ncbi:MAG: DUF1707 SHOCT-like domain-containing protein [Acidimicrobiales bacterium]